MAGVKFNGKTVEARDEILHSLPFLSLYPPLSLCRAVVSLPLYSLAYLFSSRSRAPKKKKKKKKKRKGKGEKREGGGGGGGGGGRGGLGDSGIEGGVGQGSIISQTATALSEYGYQKDVRPPRPFLYPKTVNATYIYIYIYIYLFIINREHGNK